MICGHNLPMTPKTSFRILVAFLGLIVVVALTLLSFFRQPKTRPNTFTSDTNNEQTLSSRTSDKRAVNSNVEIMSPQQISPSITTNAQQAEFFKTIIDSQSGNYAVANLNKTVVVSKNKQGDILWTNDIAAKAKSSKFPIILGEEIGSMQLVGNNLLVTFGNSFFYIDKDTGKITASGGD